MFLAGQTPRPVSSTTKRTEQMGFLFSTYLNKHLITNSSALPPSTFQCLHICALSETNIYDLEERIKPTNSMQYIRIYYWFINLDRSGLSFKNGLNKNMFILSAPSMSSITTGFCKITLSSRSSHSQPLSGYYMCECLATKYICEFCVGNGWKHQGDKL